MSSAYRDLGTVGTVGLELALSIFFGLGVGYWIDEKIGWKGPMMAVGFAFGLAAGVRAVMRAAKRMDAQSADDDRRAKDERRKAIHGLSDEERRAEREKSRLEYEAGQREEDEDP
jgi:predicted MFS family arabinose efflux permease